MKKPFIINLFGYILVVVLVSSILSSCSCQKPILEKDLGFTIHTLKSGEVISAVDLWKAYLANKTSADAAYQDKIIQVKGIVRYFGPSKRENTSYIILEKDSNSLSFIKGIQCVFDGNINKFAPEIKKGDEVTIQGTCTGKIINVFFKNCSIVK
jgi:hypothetical protein